jgi:hypothetical protein
VELSGAEIEMVGYTEIATQANLDALLDRAAGFHDSMIKELHVVNRAHVNSDHSMVMDHRFDARLLVQTQWPPFALEIVLTGIEELRADSAREFWGATGLIEHWNVPTEGRRVSLKFDASFVVVAERMFVRDRSDWLGPKPRIGSEVPEPDCAPATAIVDRWRQCSACADAFEADPGEVHVVCPTCGRMTELSERVPEAT